MSFINKYDLIKGESMRESTQRAFDSFSKIMTERSDPIYENKSEARESFLLSPYENHIQRNSVVNRDRDGSLGDYLKPFQSDYLQKTEMKTRLKMKNVDKSAYRKKTEPIWDENDERYYDRKRNQNYQVIVAELESTISKKDAKIKALQRDLNLLSSHGKSSKTPPLRMQDLEQSVKVSVPSLSAQKKKESIKQNIKIQSLKKQIRFLTHNNQTMYEQLIDMTKHCEKLEKTLNSTMKYIKEVEQKLQQYSFVCKNLEKQNQQLVKEKEDMIQNYQIQIKLFKKMKQIWRKSQKDQNISKQGQNCFSRSNAKKSKSLYKN